MGDIHCIQASHAGVVEVFEMKPPKRTIGMVNAGAIVVAYVTFFAKLDMNSPIPTAH